LVKQLLTVASANGYGTVENKEDLKVFSITYSLYIADKFYTFVKFSSLNGHFLSGNNDLKLNKLKSINQLSSI